MPSQQQTKLVLFLEEDKLEENTILSVNQLINQLAHVSNLNPHSSIALAVIEDTFKLATSIASLKILVNDVANHSYSRHHPCLKFWFRIEYVDFVGIEDIVIFQLYAISSCRTNLPSNLRILETWKLEASFERRYIPNYLPSMMSKVGLTSFFPYFFCIFKTLFFERPHSRKLKKQKWTSTRLSIGESPQSNVLTSEGLSAILTTIQDSILSLSQDHSAISSRWSQRPNSTWA